MLIFTDQLNKIDDEIQKLMEDKLAILKALQVHCIVAIVDCVQLMYTAPSTVKYCVQ